MRSLVNRRVLISMLFLAATMLGYFSYRELKVEIFPNAELPMLYVQINSRTEVTPEYMEQYGVIPVEGVIAGLEGIEKIESTAGTRRGIIYISYEKSTNTKYAYLKLTEKINSLSGTIPEQFTVRVIKVDTEMLNNNIMSLQVRGSGGVNWIRNFVDQEVTPRLSNIDGVATINVFGGQQKSVDIILNKEACDAYGITPSSIRSILSANMQTRVYSGKVDQEGKRFFVYVSADYRDVKDIENLIVGKGNARLRDIAEVYYGEKEQLTLSRVNGKEAIIMNVMNDAQANIIDLSHALRERIAELNEKFEAYDVEIVVENDAAEMMEKNIDEIINMAMIGGLLAIFILWIFLRNVSLVLVVALAIPVSVYTSFNFFFASGISINSLTLIGIALAIGMLLDNSVVVLENIYRLRSSGVKPGESVVRGTTEVWRALVASTLTTVAVFLPFLFSSDYLVRLLGRNIGVSIVSALSISLIVSLMLVPMIVNAIFERRSMQSQAYRKVSLDKGGVRLYLLLLKTALRNPAKVVIGVLLAFFITIFACLSVSFNKMQEVETSRININMTMPAGSTLEFSDGLVRQLEEKVQGIAEIQDVICNVQEENASISIVLVEKYEDLNKKTLGMIKKEIQNKIGNIPPATITYNTSAASRGGQSGGGSGGGSGRSGTAGFQQLMGIGSDEEYVVIRGQDFGLMLEVADFMNTAFAELDEISASSISVRENQPEIRLDFDHHLMSNYNITLSEVSTELNSFQNEVSTGVNFRQGTDEYEIMIKYNDPPEAVAEAEEETKTTDELRALPVATTDSGVHELQSFTSIYAERGLREIQRLNQTKEVEIRYSYQGEITSSKDLLEQSRQKIQDIIDQSGIPAGIGVELVKPESELNEFYKLIGISVILIYMILAAVFESFLTPLVLLFSIPLAAFGSFLFLTITGNSLFNSNTLIGFLILIGIVVNNGILLIDFTTLLQKRGYRLNRALLTAGLSRIRPILITAATTCVAMIPLAMGDKEYIKVIGVPFAITVIGGLSVSTMLTLIFIPTLYSGLDGVLSWFKGLKWSVRIIILLLIATGVYLSITRVDSFVWKLLDIVVIIAGIPSVYWFITSSLRKTSSRLIGDDEKIHIVIRNLVKVYGRDNRFLRELAANRKLTKKASIKNPDQKGKIEALLWQVPLLIYAIYFNWFYLTRGFWQFVISLSIYFFTLSLLRQFIIGNNGKGSVMRKLSSVFLYFMPAVITVSLYLEWKNFPVAIIIFCTWYLLLAVSKAASITRAEDFNHRTFRWYNRWFINVISGIPGIGREKERFKALKGVSLKIETGMFGLLGPNGAGKSTMMRIICGILDQSYGKIWINNFDTQEKREELQGLIGYLPQEFGMYENLTANDYLDYQAILKGLSDPPKRKDRIDQVLSLVHMSEHSDQKIGTFSGGMKQRIGIAQVLLHLPRILVVDEPTAGLDPRERIRFRNLLVELSKGRIVIFSTHIIEDVSSSCNVMAVIDKGEVIYKGTPRGMADTAKGKVWKVMMKASEFEEKTKDLLVLHHMRDGDSIRVRCLSDCKPFENATEESVLLEDAYIWLLRSKNKRYATV